jgi:hypothetical protein
VARWPPADGAKRGLQTDDLKKRPRSEPPRNVSRRMAIRARFCPGRSGQTFRFGCQSTDAAAGIGTMLNNMRYCWYLLSFAAAVLLLSSEAWGWSSGRWNMPSTPAQYFGYGYGPGHQAPMLRMPCCQPMEGPRIAYTSDCPLCNCQSCGMNHCGSTMHREMQQPIEAVPTPATPLLLSPGQSRQQQWTTFLR